MQKPQTPRIVIEDLPALELLSEEEAARIFGAGRARLSIESLESREMLASNLTASLVGDVLSIRDSQAGDQIHIRQLSGRVSVDGIDIQLGSISQSSVAASSVSRIEVHTLAGNDQVWLGDVPHPLHVPVAFLDHLAGDTVFGATPGKLTLSGSTVKALEGPDGTVFRLGSDGSLSVNGSTLDSHVTSFALGSDGALYVLEKVNSTVPSRLFKYSNPTQPHQYSLIATGIGQISEDGQGGVLALKTDGTLYLYGHTGSKVVGQTDAVKLNGFNTTRAIASKWLSLGGSESALGLPRESLSPIDDTLSILLTTATQVMQRFEHGAIFTPNTRVITGNGLGTHAITGPLWDAYQNLDIATRVNLGALKVDGTDLFDGGHAAYFVGGALLSWPGRSPVVLATSGADQAGVYYQNLSASARQALGRPLGQSFRVQYGTVYAFENGVLGNVHGDLSVGSVLYTDPQFATVAKSIHGNNLIRQLGSVLLIFGDAGSKNDVSVSRAGSQLAVSMSSVSSVGIGGTSDSLFDALSVHLIIFKGGDSGGTNTFVNKTNIDDYLLSGSGSDRLTGGTGHNTFAISGNETLSHFHLGDTVLYRGVPVPGTVTGIRPAEATVFALNTANNLYRWNGSGWDQVASVAAPDGSGVWFLGTANVHGVNHTVFRFSNGQLHDVGEVAVSLGWGAKAMWGIKSDNSLVRLKDDGLGYLETTGTFVDGSVWFLAGDNADGRGNHTLLRFTNGHLRDMGETAVILGLGAGSLWGVKANNSLIRWTSDFNAFLETSGVVANGSVWFLAGDKGDGQGNQTILRFSNGQLSTTGGFGTGLAFVAGSVWAESNIGNIFQWNGSTFARVDRLPDSRPQLRLDDLPPDLQALYEIGSTYSPIVSLAYGVYSERQKAVEQADALANVVHEITAAIMSGVRQIELKLDDLTLARCNTLFDEISRDLDGYKLTSWPNLLEEVRRDSNELMSTLKSNLPIQVDGLPLFIAAANIQIFAIKEQARLNSTSGDGASVFIGHVAADAATFVEGLIGGVYAAFESKYGPVLDAGVPYVAVGPVGWFYVDTKGNTHDMYNSEQQARDARTAQATQEFAGIRQALEATIAQWRSVSA